MKAVIIDPEGKLPKILVLKPRSCGMSTTLMEMKVEEEAFNKDMTKRMRILERY